MRTDALFEIEPGINGCSAAERLRVRQEQTAPLSPTWRARCGISARACRTRPLLSSRSPTCFDAGPHLPVFLGDGRICLSNNERALRGFALGRRSWALGRLRSGADRARLDLEGNGDGRGTDHELVRNFEAEIVEGASRNGH
jgi:transposase